MTIDEEEHWLATGDTDGVIKVWDIHDYCMKEMDEVWSRPPRKWDVGQLMWACGHGEWSYCTNKVWAYSTNQWLSARKM